jgi:hypothetical protein
MPLETRAAMRAALSVNSIIAGAYSERQGGVCPMLAAHRNGGRTSFAAFARAWDRYTGAGDAPRRATERELRTLAAMLDASLAMRHETGARERTSELHRRHGWAWLRPFRRLDDYERALTQLEERGLAGLPAAAGPPEPTSPRRAG